MPGWRWLTFVGVVACGEWEQPQSRYCELSLTLTGEVGGVLVDAPGMLAWAEVPGKDDVEVRDPTEEEASVMTAIGLDPADVADVDRYLWLADGWDLYVSFTALDGLEALQSYELFFLNLNESEAELGQDAAVLDFGQLADAILAGSDVATAVDSVRAVQGPLVGVAFNADPTISRASYAYLFNSLVDPEATWATQGSARIDGAVALDGTVLGELVYPLLDVDAVSVSGAPSFGDQETSFDADCIFPVGVPLTED